MPPEHVALVPPPYEEFRGIEKTSLYRTKRQPRGAALVWWMRSSSLMSYAKAIADRPGGLPVILVLPNALELKLSRTAAPAAVEIVRPHSVLPFGSVSSPAQVASLLRREPNRVADEVLDYLIWRGVQLDLETRRIVKRAVELAPKISTLDALARSVYLSRRALGRRFQRQQLPVPSHWLQVARLLRVTIALQASGAPLSSLAPRFGYPDSFTLSNQMHRLTGVRPSMARQLLGWEWILEAWLESEWRREGLKQLAPRLRPEPFLPDSPSP